MTGALRELFGNEQDTLDRLMAMAPERNREAEPEKPEARMTDDERLRQALAAESEANARAARAEAEARERERKPEEPGYFPDGVVIAEVEPEAEEETIEEELDSLDDILTMQRDALEDLFDSWKEMEKEPGEETEAEYDAAWDWAQGIFGDQFGDVIERIIQKMDEDPEWTRHDDIPPEWLPVLDSATWNQRQNTGANENGITRQDLAGFNALPGNIRQAVESGAKKGVSGIQVNLDGYRVGQLVAPYVSEMIASEIMY